MRKPTHKAKILTEGLRVVHQRGYSASSVRDIIQAAGVPQGSFTNHFANKEAFGLEILNVFYAVIQRLMEETLLNDALPPLQRLRTWAETSVDSLNQNEEWNGCLLGNFGAETNSEIDVIQQRLAEIFLEQQQRIAYCLRAAVAEGELAVSINCDDLAGFIHGSMEGAILMAKAQRSSLPTERFKKILFSTLLADQS
ncbi:TetR/AcrR family transcriptional regulator [Granulicella arctica]|uniref:TetR/AcrR family transcriptional regulator n=1 Tax=Granulicella arctica TaxID=940613 RepID=UPI0021DF61FE|nr:TetR/AcrR family transcriptional regulator [Granulicella arctica]